MEELLDVCSASVDMSNESCVGTGATSKSKRQVSSAFAATPVFVLPVLFWFAALVGVNLGFR